MKSAHFMDKFVGFGGQGSNTNAKIKKSRRFISWSGGSTDRSNRDSRLTTDSAKRYCFCAVHKSTLPVGVYDIKIIFYSFLLPGDNRHQPYSVDRFLISADVLHRLVAFGRFYLRPFYEVADNIFTVREKCLL
jgi:hypothetical protein